MKKLALLAAACVLLAAPSARAGQTASPLVIANSGSTNMNGYTIEIMPNGAETYRTASISRVGTVPPALLKKLFVDVRSDLPFSQLAPAGGCAKSASFGTTTTITYDGQTSPDISCAAGNPGIAVLNEDVMAVQSALQIHPVPRIPMRGAVH